MERFGQGGVTNAFLRGLGLQRGAYGLSIYPVVAQLIIYGTNGRDMAVVANRIAKLGGGIVAAVGGKVIGEVPLPLLGLLSNKPLEHFLPKLHKISNIVHDMGLNPDRSINALEWITLVQDVPYLRFCKEGLFDMSSRSIVDVIASE